MFTFQSSLNSAVFYSAASRKCFKYAVSVQLFSECKYAKEMYSVGVRRNRLDSRNLEFSTRFFDVKNEGERTFEGIPRQT